MNITRPTREVFKAWCDRDDDVDGFPFIVTFADKTTFPASEFFPTREAAIATTEGTRPVHFVMERKKMENKEKARVIWGSCD